MSNLARLAPHRLPRVTRSGQSALHLRTRSLLAVVLCSAVGLAAFLWPLFVDPGAGLGHDRDAPWVFVLLLPLLLAVVLAEIAEGGMDAKAVALLGVLSAVGAVLRPLSGGATGAELIFFLLILAGRVLGPAFGFVLGATTLFASALLTAGVGPWLPFQMLGAAWVGMFAGLLPPAKGRPELVLLAAYGLVSGVAYGVLLNMSFWPFATYLGSSLSYVPGDSVADNLGRFAAFDLATSLGWDLVRGVTNVVLVLALGRPVLLALRRAARRAAFDAPVVFHAADTPVAAAVGPAGDGG
ncbi:MAG: energy-coupling factor transport system substrate-specific component [Actinomycetota bacterium]|jgi:energy-coupling factor transport system substrate-specific component|nr:energy-coupling factor transport system substrate-specific component [Actinomycetota bacterium]